MATDGDKRWPLRLPRGSYSRIARRLRPKVTPQHVREVHLGMAVSARVSRALDRYCASLGLTEPVAESPDAEDTPGLRRSA